MLAGRLDIVVVGEQEWRVTSLEPQLHFAAGGTKPNGYANRQGLKLIIGERVINAGSLDAG